MFERTVIGNLKTMIRDIWYNAIDRMWYDREWPRRCFYCGIRIGIDSSYVKRSGKCFDIVCFYHGKYDGQVVVDCMTGCEVTIFKEKKYQYQRVMIDEIWFYIKAVIRFARLFIRDIPMMILYSLYIPIRKAIDKDQKRIVEK